MTRASRRAEYGHTGGHSGGRGFGEQALFHVKQRYLVSAAGEATLEATDTVAFLASGRIN